MNREMSDRIMTAKAYQKKAILALLPEEMSDHLEVIEKELRLMAGELLQAVLFDTCTRGSAEQKCHVAGEYTNSNPESRESGNRSNTAENGKFQHAGGTRKIEIE